ncbi:MAG: hypothetical protein O2967_05910 [Proteobacteria bacterium]|nr:hypothetical protein [Pseudomonadota bacterium]
MAEILYLNAAIAMLLIFTVIDAVVLSFGPWPEVALVKAEHGLFFIYPDLLLLPMPRLYKA